MYVGNTPNPVESSEKTPNKCHRNIRYMCNSCLQFITVCIMKTIYIKTCLYIHKYIRHVLYKYMYMTLAEWENMFYMDFPRKAFIHAAKHARTQTRLSQLLYTMIRQRTHLAADVSLVCFLFIFLAIAQALYFKINSLYNMQEKFILFYLCNSNQTIQ